MKTIIDTLKKMWLSEFRWMTIAIGIIAFGLGYWLSGWNETATIAHGDHQHVASEMIQDWTCSMHPQIRQPRAGACPICGMDLIPVNNDQNEDLRPRQLKLSPSAVKLAEISTAQVERRNVNRKIRMVGKIAYDETRTKFISAYVPGRIDRMYVDYTGTPVRRGDHLVALYSPDLISAQEELLQARRTLNELGADASALIRESVSRTVEAVRDKLHLLGLTDLQIRNIEKRNSVSDQLTIYSPISGIVIHRHASEGMYVETGSRIYTVADLSRLWVYLEAYETDLAWLQYGQTVDFEVEAYPGEAFSGRISFIDPVLNPTTRTVRIRVNVRNDDARLKPEMFVRATINSRLSGAGKILAPELAGKWISPMHPEIIKDGPGSCDVCGMGLVRVEDMGFIVKDDSNGEVPLVIPASAPLRTGRRAVVYLAYPQTPGLFEGRDIVLGPRTGDYYVVESGLKEGEWVVTNGNFKLDSDLQIKARPSMMNPASEESSTQSVMNKVEMSAVAALPSNSLSSLFDAYFEIQYALAHDTLVAATEAAGQLQMVMAKLVSEGEGSSTDFYKRLEISIAQLAAAQDIETARKAFQALSNSLIQAAKASKESLDNPVYLMHCPMAFDNTGADWLQKHDKLENPYFGAMMFRCGSQVEVIEADGDSHEGHNHD